MQRKIHTQLEHVPQARIIHQECVIGRPTQVNLELAPLDSQQK